MFKRGLPEQKVHEQKLKTQKYKLKSLLQFFPESKKKKQPPKNNSKPFL